MAARRELAQRIANGIEVRLLWEPGGEVLVVSVLDWNSGEHGEVQVARDRALDAFEHPFAYGTVLEPAEELVAA
jgi:hypothetical protein